VTTEQLRRASGIRGIRTVSDTTVVVDLADGNCRPASALERRLWALLLGLRDVVPDSVLG
jgi:hypothetical protein